LSGERRTSFMAKTNTPQRSTRLQVEIVEGPGKVSLRFDGADLPTITFDAKTGQSGKKAYRKLRKILDAADGQGKTKAAAKTAAKAVSEAVKTASKGAVKAVAERTGKSNEG
jgi:hypothetical protein